MEEAVFLNRFDEIAAAGRREAASSSQQWADGNLVETDTGDGRSSRYTEDRVT